MLFFCPSLASSNKKNEDILISQCSSLAFLTEIGKNNLKVVSVFVVALDIMFAV